jgi:NTP pyrophosphatase (non-canonical NTP hydrolase)
MGHVKVLRPTDEKKVVHIGEEVSDVVLYTTRLADLCGINLARAATIALDHPQHDPSNLAEMANALSCVEFQAWDDLSTDGYQRVAKSYMGHCRSVVDNSPRTLLYYIQTSVGKVCSRFWRYTEEESCMGLGRWKPEDKAAVALSLGRLMLSICMLCNEVGISLSQVVSDKYAKNVSKYPKELARGSSDKYTAYIAAKASGSSNSHGRSTMLVFAATIATAAVFLARAYWKRT